MNLNKMTWFQSVPIIQIERFSVESVEEALKLWSTLNRFVENLQYEFREFYGASLWQVDSGSAFSGSVKNLMNVPLTEFVKFKKSIGDVDLLVDVKTDKSLFMNFLNTKGFSVARPVCAKAVFNKIHSVFDFGFEPSFKLVQVDFDFVEFENGVPSEFSVFANSSPWVDVKKGIKGAFHKILLYALVSQSESCPGRYSFNVIKGLKDLETEEFTKDLKRLAEVCFGEGAEVEDISSFSSIVESAKSKHLFSQEQKNKVGREFFKTIFNKNLKFEEEDQKNEAAKTSPASELIQEWDLDDDLSTKAS